MTGYRRHLPSLFILVPLLSATATPLGGQETTGTRANWTLAERFNSENVSKFIHTSSVQPNWINETDSLWYEWTDGAGTRFEFVLPDGPTRRPLFDHQRMAELLTAATGKPQVAHDLPIESLEFTEEGDAFEFEVDSTRFRFDLDARTLEELEEEEEEDEREWRLFSPDSTAFIYAEKHNLYLVEVVDSVEQEAVQLTTDGEEDYSFGNRDEDDVRRERQRQGQERGRGRREFDPEDPTEYRVRPRGEWSEDSQAFFVQRSDSRGLSQDLWVINVLEDPRPELRTYDKVMGGEAVPYRELFVYRRGEEAPTELPEVHKWKDQSLVNIHFGATSHVLRLIRRDRMWQNLELIEVDLDTRDVKVLVEESLGWSTLEGGSGFGNQYQPHYVESGGDFLWWSERTGWGHFYLYDYDGNLKHPITTGPWRAASVEAVDSVARVAWIVGLGREGGESPYQKHLYRTSVDNPALTLLNPEDYDHQVSMSPSYRYLVDRYSSPDAPWRSVLRDGRSGDVVMELEDLDTTPLEALGWRPPEPFVVRSADGITDIYGNMWKPFDFDPEGKYPLIASVYPGPQSEGYSTTFNAGASQQTLAQLGFIVIQIGNRGGSPHRSAAYKAHSYQNLRDYGLADKKAGIEELAARHPFIDLERIGVYGHSGGGFMTGAAMLVPPFNEFFKVGVASNGNHDNNVYSDYWAEQNHGLQYECMDRDSLEVDEERIEAVGQELWERRQLEGDGYCEAGEGIRWEIDVPSNVDVAENLVGHLMLAFSDNDNNVHPANTIRLVRALEEADKRFDLIMIPGQAHGFGPMNGYFQRRRNEFFAEYLLGDGTHRQQVDIRD
jgi:dipeptidyl aminopeptidase/acylaminoacyl peptidase